MKPRYIIAAVIAIAFVVLLIMSFDDSTIDYASFSTAKQSGEIVQISGARLADKPEIYDAEKNILTFYMEDKQGNSAKIIYNGAQPPNFKIAPYLVIKGKYQGENFLASEILTKCPSKYEGSVEDLKKQQI